MSTEEALTYEMQHQVAETEPADPQSSAVDEPVHQFIPSLTEYRVLQAFSDGELVKSETTGTWQTHNGVDLACVEGAEVFAIDVGTVSEICNDALWGYTITIDHDNGIVSRYCGLDGSVDVREGDTVQSGQKIGKVGNTADIESALEKYLHLEVRKSGEAIDPLTCFQSDS
ncbi:MAG: M23 family metallopeptidase [Ruminococcus sp.]|nr:M23 family metallopeptidase [Ruminococcus sp.]